jgi:hypothetical protein
MWNWWPWVSAPAWANALRTELLRNQEKIVADFTAVNAKLETLTAAIGALETRVAALSANDQPAVDAIGTAIDNAVTALNGIAPTPPAP